MKLPDMLQTPKGVHLAKGGFSVENIWHNIAGPISQLWKLYDRNGIVVATCLVHGPASVEEALRSRNWKPVHHTLADGGAYKAAFRIKARRAA